MRDLRNIVHDIDLWVPNLMDRIRSADVNALPKVVGRPRLGPPIANVGKFIAIGLNYRDHAEEAGLPIPAEPIVFSKATSCIVGPCDDIILPRGSEKTDWEVELGMVIGKRASYVADTEAMEHVAGFILANDVSERSYQNERGGTWDKGKGCDSFGPIGPWLVTRDEVPDCQDLDLWLALNGRRVQTGNTSNMIFTCAEIISYVSQFMTLLPGDIVITGTPPGVGLGMKPPMYLRHGDVVSLGISGLGKQRQHVRRKI